MFGWKRKQLANARRTGYPQFGNNSSTQPGGQFPPSGIAAVAGQWNANDLPGNSPLGIPNHDEEGYLDLIGVPQPLTGDLLGQYNGAPKSRYQPYDGHSFVHAQLPDPGAPAWTFESLGLVEFSPIGTGIVNQGEILALEGAPYFPTLQVLTTGLGGIVQGELVLQPLMLDPIATANAQGTVTG